LQDIESEAPQEITQFTEKSNLLDGSNEPVQVRGGRICRAGAYIAVGALIILALGCLDLMFILRGKPVVQIDTAPMDLGG
jgi:cytochrome c biogenesis protein ResB